MRDVIDKRIGTPVIVALALTCGCTEPTPELMGYKKGAHLEEALEGRNKYVGYHILVVGELRVEGEHLLVSQFDPRIHRDIPEGATLVVEDSSPGGWLRSEGKTLEPQCTGRLVEIAGTLGELQSSSGLGIVEIDTIFLASANPGFMREEICYSADVPDTYQPRPIPGT